MPLIFITGTSTAGKSTIAKELSKRGYEAYDTEHIPSSGWHNKKTGKWAAGFGEMPERTDEWLGQHEWRISLDWVRETAEKAGYKPVFLCGGSANEPEIRQLCSKVVWLKTDEQTIKSRVNNPRDHDYGTRPHELAATIENNKQREAEYREAGAIIVDATQPIDKVVNEILTKTSVNPQSHDTKG
jgi:shikimate kinase